MMGNCPGTGKEQLYFQKFSKRDGFTTCSFQVASWVARRFFLKAVALNLEYFSSGTFGNIWKRLLVVIPGYSAMGIKPEILLNILKCTGYTQSSPKCY